MVDVLNRVDGLAKMSIQIIIIIIIIIIIALQQSACCDGGESGTLM